MAGDPTSELAAFLRARRQSLAPTAVDLPDRRGHRRTPGLRREEVAELAGVSVDYVVRLEQGRGLRPSAAVLDALADALQLTVDERRYLFDLADRRPATRSRPLALAEPPAARLVHDLSPLPAMLVNRRFDILAWNAEMAALMLDFALLPPAQRNSLRLCLMHPEVSLLFRDRERSIREGIADLRAAWAADPDDPAMAGLIDGLRSGSAEFARLWALRDVRVNGRGRKRLLHPRVGALTVEFEVLCPLQDPDQRLTVYRAADRASQAALDALAMEAADAGGAAAAPEAAAPALRVL